VKLSVLKKNQPSNEIDLSDLVLAGKFTETVFLIGRSKECHIVLDEKQISREHSKLIHLSGQWKIEKISHDSPLLLNNESIEKGYIVSGDTIAIGGYIINVEIPASIKAIDSIPDPRPIRQDEQVAAPVIKNIVQEKMQEITDEIVVEEIAEETHEIRNDDTQDIQEQQNSGDAAGEFSLDAMVEPVAEEMPSEFDSYATDSEIPVASVLEEEVATEGDSASYSLENISNDDSSGDGTQVFQTFASVTLELFGEFAPYDKFVLEAGKTYIGRDSSKCQIVINDPEVSSLHAVITKNNMLMMLEDLNSGNGTLLNGQRINKASLSHNDEFIIGATSFKIKINSEFLKEEHATLMPVDDNQTIDVEEVVEVQAEEGESLNALGEVTGNEPQEKSIIKRIWKDEEKRKKLIYALVVGIGAWVMFGDEEPAKKPVVANKKDAKSKDGKDEKTDKADPKMSTAKKMSEEERRALSERYQIGKKHFYEGRYRDALEELQKIAAIDPHFNAGLLTLIASSKEGLSKLEEQEKKRKEEEAVAERRAKVKALVVKAADYVKEHRADLAQDIFNEIAKLDPENIDVSRLKREMDDWTKEKQKKELEIAQKKKDREDKVEKLKPGKTLFLQKEWFTTIAKLEEFLKIKDMDEDLIKEASDMLKTAREEISNAVAPLQGKSKSLMEGQDLKGAYEIYQQILKIEPSNVEALNAVGDIKEQLTAKARKIYREAIISESLSLFQDAKEKFQEVQQVSPVDSDYYKKATDKLKDYLE
jgi:pSer/pThr/pTyr-binding forkhead associated (FHA) protein/Flp pilus assembly protein TadD